MLFVALLYDFMSNVATENDDYFILFRQSSLMHWWKMLFWKVDEKRCCCGDFWCRECPAKMCVLGVFLVRTFNGQFLTVMLGNMSGLDSFQYQFRFIIPINHEEIRDRFWIESVSESHCDFGKESMVGDPQITAFLHSNDQRPTTPPIYSYLSKKISSFRFSGFIFRCGDF